MFRSKSDMEVSFLTPASFVPLKDEPIEASPGRDGAAAESPAPDDLNLMRRKAGRKPTCVDLLNSLQSKRPRFDRGLCDIDSCPWTHGPMLDPCWTHARATIPRAGREAAAAA